MTDQSSKKKALLDRVSDEEYEAAPVPSGEEIRAALKRGAEKMRDFAKQRSVAKSSKAVVIWRILSVWNRHPHLRFGQLIVNAVRGIGPSSSSTANTLFYMEDDKLVETIESYSKERDVSEVQES